MGKYLLIFGSIGGLIGILIATVISNYGVFSESSLSIQFLVGALCGWIPTISGMIIGGLLYIEKKELND
jgi:hypothetical protein